MEGETIDGRPMYHVTGRYEPDVQRQSEHHVYHYGLFVDQETMRLRRLVIDHEYSTSVPAGVVGGQVQTEIAQSREHVVYDYFDYNEPLVIELPPFDPFDPCNYSADTKERLSCGRFSLRIYWLGDRLQIAGSPDLELESTSFSSNVITEDSRLTVAYEGLTTTGVRGSIYLHQWSRPEWKKYTAGFTGYDHTTVRPRGPVNWWQHPCVEEEVYQELNGAQVHLFKAHLPSLTIIFPMSDEEVGQCMKEPIGAVGAHVYFPETVVEFSLQDLVVPAVTPGSPTPIPAVTPYVWEREPPHPELVLLDRNPYNDLETARSIAASLKPFIGE